MTRKRGRGKGVGHTNQGVDPVHPSKSWSWPLASIKITELAKGIHKNLHLTALSLEKKCSRYTASRHILTVILFMIKVEIKG